MLQLHALPHHDGSALYSPDGVPALGADVRLRVRIPAELGSPLSVHARVLIDAEPRYTALAPMTLPPRPDPDAQWWEASVHIGNPRTSYRFLLNLRDGSSQWLNAQGVDRIEPLDALDFPLTTAPPPTSWARDQVMYQIFPDRFAPQPAPALAAVPTSGTAGTATAPIPEWAVPAEWHDEVLDPGIDGSRQVFGGHLDGITIRLDHLEQLGVTLLYLTPFFPAQSNHRYDAASFSYVDPLLGGDEALVRLVEAAHVRGMKVIGDLTTNHTGSAHEWFVRARNNPNAPERDFYYWTGDGPDDYVAWYGVPTLPKLNWNSIELRRRFVEGAQSTVAKWLLPPFELDGWRIDVANMTGRLGSDDLNREIRRAVHATMQDVAPDTVLYAESTNDAAPDFDGWGWQGAMSYSPLTRPLWHWLRIPQQRPRHHFGIPLETEPRYTARDVVESYRRFTAAYPWPLREVMMNAIDTHDTPRFAERAGDAEQLVAAGLTMTLPGTPVIFAGDEFGLRGATGEQSRTPLPWHTDPRLAGAYAELTRARAKLPPLRTGSLRWMHADDHALAFVREGVEGSVLVVASNGDAQVSLPVTPARGELQMGDIRSRTDDDALHVTLAGPALGIWVVG
jgi:alpha-glucosidase